MEIYIVTTAAFDGSDDNLYQNSRAFKDEEKAKEFFDAECKSCKDDALGIYGDGDIACFEIDSVEFEDFAGYWRKNFTYHWQVEIHVCTI